MKTKGSLFERRKFVFMENIFLEEVFYHKIKLAEKDFRWNQKKKVEEKRKISDLRNVEIVKKKISRIKFEF